MLPLPALLTIFLASTLAMAAEPPKEPDYPLGPDSQPKDGIPQGTITQHEFRSDIFKGTLRQYYLYIPAGHEKDTEAALMVFQDGHAYVQQDGSSDLNNQHGNWWLGNLQMESALQFIDYDLKTVWGEGAHNGKHGGAIFPDTMRWLWRDWKPAR